MAKKDNTKSKRKMKVSSGLRRMRHAQREIKLATKKANKFLEQGKSNLGLLRHIDTMKKIVKMGCSTK